MEVLNYEYNALVDALPSVAEVHGGYLYLQQEMNKLVEEVEDVLLGKRYLVVFTQRDGKLGPLSTPYTQEILVRALDTENMTGGVKEEIEHLRNVDKHTYHLTMEGYTGGTTDMIQLAKVRAGLHAMLRIRQDRLYKQTGIPLSHHLELVGNSTTTQVLFR